MTNGEKLKEIFPNMIFIGTVMLYKPTEQILVSGINYNWLNAEYQEPSSSGKPNRSEISTGSIIENDCENCTHNKGILEYDMCGCKYEPATKNNLGVDCISRADAIHAVSEALERTFVEHEDIANKLIGKLPAVTPQEPKYIVNESGDLVKDTISRQAVIDTIYAECSGTKLDIDFAKVLLLQRAIKALPSVTLQGSIEKCKWIKYDYRTMCPKEHIDVDNPYWRIPENRMETLKYCPYCGKEIEVEV